MWALLCQAKLRELDEKYKKAMMMNAQLDNEKHSLVYKVELMKDQVEEMEESFTQLQREYKDKCRVRIPCNPKNPIQRLRRVRIHVIPNIPFKGYSGSIRTSLGWESHVIQNIPYKGYNGSIRTSIRYESHIMIPKIPYKGYSTSIRTSLG